MLGYSRLSQGLLLLLLLIHVAVNMGRRTGAPSGSRKLSSADKPRRPKASSDLGSKKKASSAVGSSSSSRKSKGPVAGSGSSRRKAAPVVDPYDDEEEDEVMASFGGGSKDSKDRRRGGDFNSFGDRAVKRSSRRRLDEDEDEDEEEEEEEELLGGSSYRGRGGRRGVEEEEDEEDFEEEDDDEDDRYARRKPSRRKARKGGRYGRDNSQALAAYGKKKSYQVKRVPLQARLMQNINILGEKVSGFATKGRKMTRELKEYFSGDFESMLLKVTRPDDQRPPEDVVGAILDATATFYRDEDVTANTNPYRVTLRKLWTKMAERDWRTVAKALYVFHVLLRECEPDDVRIFKKIYLKMCKEMCKKTKDRYFNGKRIEAVDSGDVETFNAKGFIERYARYVLQRAKTFTSKFEEMKVIGERDITPKDLVGQLLKAEKVIASGVECGLDAEDETEVSIMCVELVARDVHDLFRLFHDKLRWVLDNEAQALEGTDPEEVTKILDRFKTSYEEQYPKVQEFLANTADMLSVYGIKLKTRIEPKHNFAAQEEDDEGAGGAEADGAEAEVASSSSSSSGKAGSSSRGGKGAAYGNEEEGALEEEEAEDLTAYDDATPWDGGARSGGRGRGASDDYDE